MLNWSEIANAINNVNNAANTDIATRGQVLQPWQQFLLPLQLGINNPQTLMQQARDTNENYYGYIQTINGSDINQTILLAAGGLIAIYLLFD